MLAVAQDSELDRGATSVAPGTERTCALTRELKPVAEMIRFVVGPAGDAVPDVKRKLPGRGIWVTATRARNRGCNETQCICPRLQAGRPCCLRSGRANRAADRTCRARRPGNGGQGRRGRHRIFQGGGGVLPATTSWR